MLIIDKKSDKFFHNVIKGFQLLLIPTNPGTSKNFPQWRKKEKHFIKIRLKWIMHEIEPYGVHS